MPITASSSIDRDTGLDTASRMWEALLEGLDDYDDSLTPPELIAAIRALAAGDAIIVGLVAGRRKMGRRPKMSAAKIAEAKKLRTSGVPVKVVAKNLGVSIQTLYRWVPPITRKQETRNAHRQAR